MLSQECRAHAQSGWSHEKLLDGGVRSALDVSADGAEVAPTQRGILQQPDAARIRDVYLAPEGAATLRGGLRQQPFEHFAHSGHARK